MKLIKLAAALGTVAGLAALPCQAQNASEPSSMASTMGIGAAECSAWLRSHRAEEAGIAWILGAWTGMNMANPTTNRQVGDTLGPQAIVAAIKTRCQSAPATPLAKIVHAFYSEAWTNKQ